MSYTWPWKAPLAPSLRYIEQIWNSGEKLAAIAHFNNRLPEIVLHYLWNDRFYEDGQVVLLQQNGWQFTGPNAIPTWFREPFHWLGGFAMTLPFIYWPTLCFVASIAIAIWKAAAEYYGDAQGKPDLKNVVDWLFWIMGTVSVTIPSFLLFGTYPYK
jgi:hypothetical protein